ncbi:MAG: transcription antitermination factor NusB [Acetivibrionales bacterium]|jgi:N utilization substance protein B
MGRRATREIAMKLLYQIEIRKDNIGEQITSIVEENDFNDKDKEYLIDVVNGVIKNKNQIDERIEKYLKGWKLNRISKVDLAIMRLSIYEQIFRKDIPLSVSINEAVELAKKYSTEDSGSFINGVLSKLMQSENLI